MLMSTCLLWAPPMEHTEPALPSLPLLASPRVKKITSKVYSWSCSTTFTIWITTLELVEIFEGSAGVYSVGSTPWYRFFFVHSVTRFSYCFVWIPCFIVWGLVKSRQAMRAGHRVSAWQCLRRQFDLLSLFQFVNDNHVIQPFQRCWAFTHFVVRLLSCFLD